MDYIFSVLERSKSHFLSSLLKNGYSIFKVDILEFSDKKDLLAREQYYIDLLKPKFNILTKAYSSLGAQLSEETRLKMSIAAKNRPKISEETRAKLSAAKVGLRGTAIKLIDQTTGNSVEYVSMGQAAKALGVRSEKVRRCFLAKTVLLGKYLVIPSSASEKD